MQDCSNSSALAMELLQSCTKPPICEFKVWLSSALDIVMLYMYMLNWFNDYKRHIHILNCILDLAWPKWMKLNLEQQYMPSVLHSQYHACWCSGDFRSQVICRHGIDCQSRNIPSPASKELTLGHMTGIHSELVHHHSRWCWVLGLVYPSSLVLP